MRNILTAFLALVVTAACSSTTPRRDSFCTSSSNEVVRYDAQTGKVFSAMPIPHTGLEPADLSSLGIGQCESGVNTLESIFVAE